MKKLSILIVFLVVIFSFGCSNKQVNYGIDAAVISSEYSVLKGQYKELRDIVEENIDVVEEKDKEDLAIIDENVKRITEKTDTLLSSKFYEVPVVEISYMYILARDSYSIARKLYVKYESNLTRSEAFTLQIFDERLQVLDEDIQEFLDNPEYQNMNTMLSDILSISSQAMRIAVPLLLI